MLSRTGEKSANCAPAPMMGRQHGLARLHGALTTRQIDAPRRERVHTQGKSSHCHTHDRSSFLSSQVHIEAPDGAADGRGDPTAIHSADDLPNTSRFSRASSAGTSASSVTPQRIKKVSRIPIRGQLRLLEQVLAEDGQRLSAANPPEL